MEASKAIDLFPFASSPMATRFGMPIRTSVILIRWPVVIICAYLLLYPLTPVVPEYYLHPFVLVYIASNVVLYFVKEEIFSSKYFYYPLVITDTVILTLSLVINGHMDADFYLFYFLLIIICCLLDNARLLAIVSVLAPVVYLMLLFGSIESLHPSVFLRLPFLFIVSLFYGYFTQLVRTEKILKDQAEQRYRGKEEALDILSHEFRTPLNLISGYAQAMKTQVFGDISSKQEEALAKILRQSDNLLYLVNGILDLARVEAGERSVQREQVVLSDFLQQFRMYYETPPDKPISLQWSVPSDLPTIWTDKMKLTIILQNLINNAIKYTDNGTIEIIARRSADAKGVDFEIADTGIGIARDVLPFIFEKFRQADSSTTRSYSGVGLGLYIVKAFVEVLGGTIKVESELNRGSRFTLWLPA